MTDAAQTVRHLILCQFKPGTPPERIGGFIAAFRALKELIPGVLSFEHGANNSLEGLNRGMEYAVLLTFESAAARDAYLPHPAHQHFVATQTDILAGVQVLDYAPQS